MNSRKFAILHRWLRWYGLPFLLLALVVYIYLRTLASGVMPEDAGEFQTRFYTLEPAHPTGYPLLIILGKLWVTLWPLGSVADRGNRLAMLLSMGTVLTTYSIVMLLTNEPLAALFAGLTLAFTPTLWLHSTKAGSYPLHTFLVSLSWLALLRWQQGKGTLYLAVLAIGMGLAHHRIFLLSLPALGLFILLQDPALLRHGRQQATLALVAALPFLSYLLLPLWGIWPLPNFLSHVLLINNPMGRLILPVHSLEDWWRRLQGRVWPSVVQGLGQVGLFLGLAGLALLGLWALWPRLSRRQRLLVSTAYLLLMLTHWVLFAAFFIVPNDRRYYVSVDLALSVGVGLAAAWMLWRIQRLARPAMAWAWRCGLTIAMLALPAWEVHHHWPVEDQEHGRFVTTLTREGLVAVETNAAIIASPGFVTAYWYYQQVEGWRPDVTVYMDGVTINREQAFALIEDNHPVYFRESLYGLDRPDSSYAWLPFGRGGLDRAVLHPPTPVRTVEADRPFGPALRLVGAAMSAAPLRPDSFVTLWLQWETSTLIPDTTGFSVWLEDERGHRWWQRDARWGGAITAITSTNLVSTTHHMVVPAGMPPGLYHWHVLIYDDQEPWGEPWQTDVTVGRPLLPLSRNRFPLSHPLPTPWVVGPVAMLGYNCPEEPLMAGSVMPISFLWQALDIPAADWQMQLRIERADRREETCSPLVPGYPTHRWQAGDLLVGNTALRIPGNWPGGRYRLTLEVHHPQGVAVHTLKPVHVAARPILHRVPRMAHSRDDRLGEAIRLLGYDLQSQVVAPGEVIHLTLYWQALGTPDGNYKVFNHLVSADALLAGQQDGLPGGGTILSSEWAPGEVVVDRYAIRVREETPPGEYTLCTGMYRPGDGWRLPAWDGAGHRWLNDVIALDRIKIETR